MSLPLAREDSRDLASALRGGAAAFTRYLATGAASFAVDFAVYSLLIGLAGLHEQLANGISRPIGGLVCFFLNRRWTFGSGGRKSPFGQFVSFWCVFALSLGLVAGLIWLFHRVLGIDEYVAKPAAEGVAFVFNFLSLKLWTFR